MLERDLHHPLAYLMIHAGCSEPILQDPNLRCAQHCCITRHLHSINSVVEKALQLSIPEALDVPAAAILSSSPMQGDSCKLLNASCAACLGPSIAVPRFQLLQDSAHGASSPDRCECILRTAGAADCDLARTVHRS